MLLPAAEKLTYEEAARYQVQQLDFHFDRYIFVEKDPDYIKLLEKRILEHPSGSRGLIYTGDCNERLKEISSFPWQAKEWRGVIFLDPYSLEVKWQTLEEISKTKALDVWYLFPYMALNRLLRRDKDIPGCHRTIIDTLLGTDGWEKEMYSLSPQISLFGDVYEKNSLSIIKQYIIQRLDSIFPAVSPNSLVLRTEQTNTPLFLLCFATSNPTERAKRLALTGANYILSHT